MIYFMEIKCEDMMEIAIGAGSIVLENGGETYRTEETVNQIAKALGAKTVSSFVTPTVIQFSYTDENNHYHSAIRRITKRGTNLKKIAQVNELSRRISRRQKLSNPRQIENLLNKINKTTSYSNFIMIFMAALSSFFFALMFGGSIIEGFAAFFVGLFLRIFLIFIEKYNLGVFFNSLSAGAITSVFTDLLFILGFISQTEIVLISVLMQVVPGLAIVNAIRDIIAGDLVAGNARIVEAFMIAAALSVGSVFGFLVFTFLGISTNDLFTVAKTQSLSNFPLYIKILLPFIFAMGASGFSAFYLNTNLFDVLPGALIGGLGWLLFSFVGDGGVISYFVGAFAVAIFSEIIAHVVKNPATIYLLPGLLPLVPGGGMFKTMRFCANGLIEQSLSSGFSTLCSAGAIALGIALASSIAKIMSIIYKNKINKINQNN